MSGQNYDEVLARVMSRAENARERMNITPVVPQDTQPQVTRTPTIAEISEQFRNPNNLNVGLIEPTQLGLGQGTVGGNDTLNSLAIGANNTMDAMVNWGVDKAHDVFGTGKLFPDMTIMGQQMNNPLNQQSELAIQSVKALARNLIPNHLQEMTEQGTPYEKALADNVLGNTPNVDKNVVAQTMADVFNQKERKERLFNQYSNETQQAFNDVEQTLASVDTGNWFKDFWESTKTIVNNPTYMYHTGVQSLPVMVASMFSKNPVLTASFFEGTMGRDSARAFAMENGLDLNDPKIQDAMIRTGAGNALITYGFSKITPADVDNGVAGIFGKHTFGQRVRGVVNEGIEEALIANDETMNQNHIAGKPLLEGTAQATATGLTAGTSMSLAMQGLGMGANAVGIGANQTGKAVSPVVENIKGHFAPSHEQQINPEHKRYNPTEAYMQAHSAYEQAQDDDSRNTAKQRMNEAMQSVHDRLEALDTQISQTTDSELLAQRQAERDKFEEQHLTPLLNAMNSLNNLESQTNQENNDVAKDVVDNVLETMVIPARSTAPVVNPVSGQTSQSNEVQTEQPQVQSQPTSQQVSMQVGGKTYTAMLKNDGDGQGEYFEVQTNNGKTRYYHYNEANANELTHFGKIQVHKDAVDSLQALSKAFQQRFKQALTLVSGFRSYDYQKNTNLAGKLSSRTAKDVFTSNAWVGGSKHHTGLAFDFLSTTPRDFEKGGRFYEQGKWLQENAEKYGLSLSYPKDNKGNVMYEAWEFVYQGTDRAKQLLTPKGANVTSQSVNQQQKSNQTFNASKPIAIMGSYSKYRDQVGAGTADHFDISVRSANENPNKYWDRFMVDGKDLAHYAKTFGFKKGQEYGASRSYGGHKGCDFSINQHFGGQANKELMVSPQWADKVANIEYGKSVTRTKKGWGGYGNYTDITFTDGVKIRIGHQDDNGINTVKGYHGGTVNQTPTATTASSVSTNTDNRAVKIINPRHDVVSNSKGSITLELADGTQIVRTGTRGWRNNNSGNLEASAWTQKQEGYLGSDGRFAIFDTWENGQRAKFKLLFEGSGYKNLTIANAISRYAPSVENNTRAYIDRVLSVIPRERHNIKMSEFSDSERQAIIQAMSEMEGSSKQGEVKVIKQGTGTSVANTQVAQLQSQESTLLQEIDTAMQNNVSQDQLDELQAQLTDVQEQLVNLSSQSTQQSEQAQTEPVAEQPVNNKLDEAVVADIRANKLQQLQMHFASLNIDDEAHYSKALNQINELEQSGVFSANEANAYRMLLEEKQRIKGLNPDDVSYQIYHGKKGKSTLETNLGLNQHNKRLLLGLVNGSAEKAFEHLARMRADHNSKAEVIEQALSMYNGSPIYMGYNNDLNKWEIVDRKLPEGYRSFEVSTNKPNKVMRQIFQEAKDIDTFTTAWENILFGESTTTPNVPVMSGSQETTANAVEPTPTPAPKPVAQPVVEPSVTPTPTQNKPNTRPVQYISPQELGIKVGVARNPAEMNDPNGVWVGRANNVSMSMFTLGKDGRYKEPIVGSLGSPYNILKEGKKPNAFSVADEQEAFEQYEAMTGRVYASNKHARAYIESLRGKTLYNGFGEKAVEVQVLSKLLHATKDMTDEQKLKYMKKVGEAQMNTARVRAALNHQGKGDTWEKPKSKTKPQTKEQTNDEVVQDIPEDYVSHHNDETQLTDEDMALFYEMLDEAPNPKSETKPTNNDDINATNKDNKTDSKPSTPKPTENQSKKDILENGIKVNKVSLSQGANEITAGKHKLIDVIHLIGFDNDSQVIANGILKVYPDISISFDKTEADIKADINKPKDILQSLVSKSTHQLLAVINEDTDDKQFMALKDDLDLIIARLKQLSGLPKKETLIVDMLIQDYESLIGLGLRSKAFLSKIETNDKTKSNLFSSLINGIKSFFGIPNKTAVSNLYERLLDVTARAIEIQAKDNNETYKLSFIAQDKEQRQAELDKPYNEMNVLTAGFTQSGFDNLITVKDLTSRLRRHGLAEIKRLGIDKPTDKQQEQLEHFLGFETAFKDALEMAFRSKDNAFRFQDLKQFTNTGTDGAIRFDDNLITAMTHAVYDWVVSLGGSTELNKRELRRLLGVDSDTTVPYEIAHKYRYMGYSINEVTVSLGKTVLKDLGLKQTDDVPEQTQARLEASLGDWILSAMQVSDMVKITTIPTQEFKADLATLNNVRESELKEVGNSMGKTSFVKLTTSAVNKEIVEVSKQTGGYLANVLGIQSRKVYPKLTPNKLVNENIKKTKGKLSKKQAERILRVQEEPIVLNQGMFDIADELIKQDETLFMDLLGARIPTDDELNTLHKSKRESTKESAEGNRRDVVNMLDFAHGLPSLTTQFYDDVSVVINSRMHFTSNVFNFQSSKVHRAFGEYANFKQEVELEFDKDGHLVLFKDDKKANKLNHFIKAIFENAEGTEDIFEEHFKAMGYVQGFTVDKIPSKDFMPVALNYLLTDPQVQSAVSAINALQNKEQLSQEQKDSIKGLVATWKMEANSLRALMETTNFLNALRDKKSFTTSLGLGSDGINNGTAIGSILMGIWDTHLYNQIGIFETDSPYESYGDTRINPDVGDYYTGLKPFLINAIDDLKIDDDLVETLAILKKLNTNLTGRKMLKAILIPFGYGAGNARLVQSATEQFVKDVYAQMEKIAGLTDENLKSAKFFELQKDLQVILGANYTLDTNLLDVVFTDKQLSVIYDVYGKTIGRAVNQAIDDYASKFSDLRTFNVAIHESMYTAFELYKDKLEREAEAMRVARIKERYADVSKHELDRILAYETLTPKERKEWIDDKLKDAYPTIASSYEHDEDGTQSIEMVDNAKTLINDGAVSTSIYLFDDETESLKGRTRQALIRAKKITSAGVRANSQMIQGTDSIISSEAMVAGDVVSINVHDADIGNISHYDDMAIAQNKAFFTNTAKYHIYHNSIQGLIKTIENLSAFSVEEQQELVTNWISVFSRSNLINDTKYLNKLVGTSVNEAVKLLVSDVVNAGYKQDLAKLENLGKVGIIHQYGGENGQYHLTKDDYQMLTNETEKLNTLKEETLSKALIAVMDYQGQVGAIENVQYGKDTGKWYLKFYTELSLADVQNNPQIHRSMYVSLVNGGMKLIDKKSKLLGNVKEIANWVVRNRPELPKQSTKSAKLKPNEITNYTGGAYGADTMWDLIGREYGVTNHIHIRPHTMKALSKQLRTNKIQGQFVNQEQLDTAYDEVIKLLGLDIGSKDTDDLKARNYYQVVNADSVLAIAPIKESGVDVTGGTSVAVRLGIAMGKPVYVWNTDTQTWYEFDYKSNQFIQTDTPTLTKNFAGVGTRDIENYSGGKNYLGDSIAQLAEQAIHDVYAKSFGVDSVKEATTTDDAEVLNIWFSSNENAELSNLAYRPFTLDGREYQSVEHYYQTNKTGNFNEALYKNPKWKVAGTKIQGGTAKTTDGYNVSIMKEAMKSSFEQNPEALQALLDTGNKTITHKQDKGLWAEVFPKLLMEIREELSGSQQVINTSIDNALSSQSQHILDSYTNGSQNSLDLFNKLVNINPNQKITLLNKDTVVGSGLTDAGMFFEETNEIKVNVDSEHWYATPLELINHELIHSVTRDVISAGKYEDKIQEIKDNIFELLGNNKLDLSHDTNGKIANRIVYAITNTQELFTVTLAENQVREVLPKEVVGNIENLFNQIIGEFNATRPNQPKSRENVNVGEKHLSSNSGVQPNGQQSGRQAQSDDNNQRNARLDVATTTIQSSINKGNPAEQLETQTTRGDTSIGLSGRGQGNEVRQSRVGQSFNLDDLHKVGTNLNADKHLTELFNALYTAVSNTHPNLKIEFVATAEYSAKFHNNTITINESQWQEANPNDKLSLINHELTHAVTLFGLSKVNSEAVKDLGKMYDQLKQVFDSGNFGNNILQEIFNTDRKRGIAEMVAYGIENKVARDFIAQHLDLKKAGVKAKTKTGVLDTFYTAIQSLFEKLGFKKKPYKTFLANVNAVIELNTSAEHNNMEIFSKALNEANETPIVDIFTNLNRANVSDEHNQRLDSLIGVFIGSYYNDSANKALVDLSQGKIKNTALISGLQSSDKEAYVTEAMYTVFDNLLTNHKGTLVVNGLDKLYTQALTQFKTAKDLFSQYETTSKQEQARLRAIHQKAFNPKNKNSLAWFMALAVSNEELANALSQVRLNTKKERVNKTWFDKVMGTLEEIVNYLNGVFFKARGSNTKALIDAYVKALAKVETQARNGQVDYLQKGYEWGVTGLRQKLDKPFRRALIGAMGNKFFKNSSNGYLRNISGISVVLDEIEFLQDGFNKNKGDELINLYQNKIQDTINPKKRMGTLSELVNEVLGLGKRGMNNDALTRGTQRIAQEREVVSNNTTKVIKSMFNKELTNKQSKAVTQILLRTELASLISHGFKAKEVIGLLNKTKRDKLIADYETKLTNKLGKEIAYDMIHQTHSLAYYLATGNTSIGLVKSAEGIAIGLGRSYQTTFENMDKDVYQMIDVLATLHALDFVDNRDITAVNKLLDNELDGLVKVLNLHNELIKQGKADFETNPYNYQKGYIPEIVNPYRKVVWVNQDDIAKYAEKGFEVITELKQDIADKTDSRVLMIHTDYQSGKYVSGALDMVDTHHRGTPIYEQGVNDREIHNVIKEHNKAMQLRANKKPDIKDFDKSGNALVATYDTQGAVLDYHYEMSHSVRDSLLERDNDFVELLGVLAGNLVFKPEMTKHQQEVAKVIAQDSKSFAHKKADEYIWLDFNSTDPDVRRVVRMIPYPFRAELKRQFGNGVSSYPIHKSLYNATFGYQAYSVTNIWDKLDSDKRLTIAEKLIKNSFDLLFKENGRKRALQAERIIQDFMSLIKDMIVVRSGGVLLGNILSNTYLLMTVGINPIRILKDSTFAWRNVKNYRNNANRIAELDTLILATKNTKELSLYKSERKKLEESNKRNPLKMYMEAGLMSTIIEDLSKPEDKKFKSEFDKWVDKYTDIIPKPIQNTFNEVVVGQGSYLHNFLSEATQFSDFSAKYTLAKYHQEKGMSMDKAIYEAQMSFINYDIPTNQALDYLNRVGLTMFTKFFLRFQRVMTRLAYNAPLSSLMGHYAVEMMGGQGVYEPFVLNRLGNPLDGSILLAPSAMDNVITNVF